MPHSLALISYQLGQSIIQRQYRHHDVFRRTLTVNSSAVSQHNLSWQLTQRHPVIDACAMDVNPAQVWRPFSKIVSGQIPTKDRISTG